MKRKIIFLLLVVIFIFTGFYFYQKSGLTNENSSIQHLENLDTRYISAQEWPPKVEVRKGVYLCKETSALGSWAMKRAQQRTINDKTYCVEVESEGAAGSVFSSYVYTTLKGDDLVSVSFVLRFINCSNYDEEQNQACAEERETFNPDAMVDGIVQSIK